MKVILNPYSDPSSGKDWHEQTPEIEKQIDGILETYPEQVDYSIHETNFGGGADWPTIALNVATIAGVGFFAIPEAHKQVREALEEWQLIGANIQKLIAWISGRTPLVSQPIELIFVAATEELLSMINEDDAIFLNYQVLSPVGTNDELSGLFEFRFEVNSEEWRVIIDGLKQVRSIKKT